MKALRPYLIIAIYDSGYEFDVYASNRKITKRQKIIIKMHYDDYYYRGKFENYLKRYYGKYDIIIVENGFIEKLKEVNICQS